MKASGLIRSFFIFLAVSSALIVLAWGTSSAPQSTTQQTNIPASLRSSANPSPSSNQPDSVTPGLYWFQVGAWGANGRRYGSNFGMPVSGASVEIRVNYRHFFAEPNGEVVYWVGISLPSDSFIQVGYSIQASNGYPQWFWAYFLHDAANPPSTCDVTCPIGDNIGPNATWYKFSLAASGTRWYAFVNGIQVGSVDLGVSNSGTNGPFAVAEVPKVRNANTVLGPVEFRNLEYRDMSGSWHMVQDAVSLCCYGVISDTFSGAYPYGVESNPGQSNVWIAGSNLPSSIQEEGDYLWPWYQVNVEGLPQGWTFPNGWYVYGSSIDLTNVPQVLVPQDTSRYSLEGWYVNGKLESAPPYVACCSFTATENMTLKPDYVQQWLVQVNSKLGAPVGSGWYNDGATATVGVSPAFILASGVLGRFKVGSTVTGWAGYNIPIVNGESKIQVNSSMLLTATWSTTYGVLPYYSLLIIPAIALVLYLRRLKHKSN